MLTLESTPGLLDQEPLVPGGATYLHDIERRLAPYFERAEPRQRAMAYVRGLLSPAQRKNSWQLAEVSGDATPYAIQHLLRRAHWDPEAVRGELRAYIVRHLGDPEAVLVLDETSFHKKGRHSAGVTRQDSGRAGTRENCQIGIFLGYAGPLGHALLDRELFLPQEWITDRIRRRQAGIPGERSFMTKAQLAQCMLARAFGAGVPAKWVTGDRVYGTDRRLRMWLEGQPQAYVLAVSGQEYVGLSGQQSQVNTILAALPDDAWTRFSADGETHGPRWYDWHCLPLTAPREPGWRRWLLVRRNASPTQGREASLVFAPQQTAVTEMIRVVGTGWTTERCLETAKDEVGLDHYEVRSWTGWYRHITLAMWALALLTVLRADAIAVEAFKNSLPLPPRSSLAAFKAGRGLVSR